MKETQGAIKFYIDCVENRRFPFVLAVELKETGELIGDVGLCLVVDCLDEVEIGYTICRKYSGNGYATQLVQGMEKFAYETFGIQVLYGRILHGNDASIRVLEKNGYSFLLEEKDVEDDPYGKGMLIYKKSVLSD